MCVCVHVCVCVSVCLSVHTKSASTRIYIIQVLYVRVVYNHAVQGLVCVKIDNSVRVEVMMRNGDPIGHLYGGGEYQQIDLT